MAKILFADLECEVEGKNRIFLSADTIDATGVSGTILLTTGELQITHDVTINGPGTANLAVNGNATFRVFENSAANVTISGLTITNRFLSAGFDGGAGIRNDGSLTLSNVTVSGNSATSPSYGGGGFWNRGTLTINNVTLSNNSAVNAFGGAGILNESGTTLTITDSIISGNSAPRRTATAAASNSAMHR